VADNTAYFKRIVQRMMQIQYQENWQFLIKIDGFVDDLDMFVKDISFGAVEIETEQKKVGGGYLTFPTAAAPVQVSMTMKDDQDRKIYNAFLGWSGKIVNADGTINPPMHPKTGYLKKWTRVQVLQEPNGQSGGYQQSALNYFKNRASAAAGVNVNDIYRETKNGTLRFRDTDSWWMYVTQVGDITESRDEAGFIEFPITLIQFRSLGQSA